MLLLGITYFSHLTWALICVPIESKTKSLICFFFRIWMVSAINSSWFFFFIFMFLTCMIIFDWHKNKQSMTWKVFPNGYQRYLVSICSTQLIKSKQRRVQKNIESCLVKVTPELPYPDLRTKPNFGSLVFGINFQLTITQLLKPKFGNKAYPWW